MSNKFYYQVVGRYMDGKQVTAYHLQSMDGKAGKYTKEQVAFLIGNGQITNCTAQIYKDKLLLRGKGISLDDLPVQYEDGDTRNVDKIKRGATVTDVMEQLLIVSSIKLGRNTVGYVLQNNGGGTKKIKREQVIELASQGKIKNARVQNYQGKVLLRGVGCNLDELPCEYIGDTNSAEAKKSEEAKVKNEEAKDKKRRYTSVKEYILATNDELIRKMKVVVDTENEFTMEYDGGYIKFIIEDDGDRFKIEWSASNGFDGGEAEGLLTKDRMELFEFIEKAGKRIKNLQLH